VQVEFAFTLPTGYLDAVGNLYRDGVMRLATAADEVGALDDGRTRSGEAYTSIALLSRVIIRLGDIFPVPPAVIAKLFASDFAYLQDLYLGLNQQPNSYFETECPQCGLRFGLNLAVGSGDQQPGLTKAAANA